MRLLLGTCKRDLEVGPICKGVGRLDDCTVDETGATHAV